MDEILPVAEEIRKTTYSEQSAEERDITEYLEGIVVFIKDMAKENRVLEHQRAPLCSLARTNMHPEYNWETLWDGLYKALNCHDSLLKN